MAEDTFHCSVVTPERAIFECDATSAVFPAWDGEVGILPGRAPLLCRLGIGILRVKTADETHRFFIDGGFAQMVDNKLTLLTEQARSADEVEHAAALATLEELKAQKAEGDGSVYDARQTAIKRAEAQVKLSTPESPY